MKDRFLRRVIPLTAALVFLVVFSVPALLYLRRTGAAATFTTAKIILAAGAFVYLAGFIAGVLLHRYLFKRLPWDSYRRILFLIAAVAVLLMVLGSIACIFLLGAG